MNKDNVSIIVPCYKEKKKWFDIAIQSILNQNGVNVHLILSTVENDPSIKWIKKFEGDIEIVTMEDHGKKDPENSFKQLINAIPHLKHRWMCFASANDPLLPNKCAAEIGLLCKSGKLVCYSARKDADENMKILKEVPFPEKYDFEKHMKSNFIYDGSMVWTKTFKEFMPFSSLYNCGYWDLWLRMYDKLGDVFIYNPLPAKLYIAHKDSMHLKRKGNEANKKRHAADKKKMLAIHRKASNSRKKNSDIIKE